MWTTPSVAFDTAITEGGVVSVMVELLNNSVFPPTATAAVDTGLAAALTDSSVAVSRDGQVWRSCSLSISYDAGFSTFFSQANFGVVAAREWRVSRGFIISGSPQYVPLGVFHTKNYRIEKSGTARTIHISGEDRSATAAGNRFRRPYTISATTLYPAAISGLVSASVAGRFAYDQYLGENIDAVPRMVFSEDESPWNSAKELATSIATEIFFDPSGKFIFRGLAEDFLGIAPTYVRKTGASGGIMAPVAIEEDLDDVVNGVIVRGSAPWLLFPVYGEAWDDTSPVRRGSALGERPVVIDNSSVATNARANQIASDLLNHRKGRSEILDFGHTVDPKFEAGDILRIQTADMDTMYIIDSFEVPLSYDRNMTVKAKRRSPGA